MESEIVGLKLVRSRRAARTAALKAIYQHFMGGSSPSEALQMAFDGQNFAPETAEFTRELVEGVSGHVQEIDEALAPCLSSDWRMERLPKVDLCILRLAAYELLFLPEMPPKVTIDEAVSLAKKFSTAESGKFINGVLGQLLKNSPKAQSVFPLQALQEEEALYTEETPEEAPETLHEGSPEYEALRRAGTWVREESTEDKP